VERGEKRREVVYFFQYTRHGKRRGIERSDTQENTSVQTACRVLGPRCNKCTKISLGFLAVWLSPREPKKCYGLEGTSIQGLKYGRAKIRKETRDLPSFDPLAIANDMNQRNRIKRATSEGLNPHLIRSMGIENKRGKNNGIRTLLTNSPWNGRRLEERGHDPTIQIHRRAPRPCN
jgi:hypothetical protein